MLLREVYLHPNGQIPAYEWRFGDVNPPVQAFAALTMYGNDKQKYGSGDKNFLKLVFQKLLLNFSWWANRKDPSGRNLFEGGFLGLDNIGVFDRSQPLPHWWLPGTGRRNGVDGAVLPEYARDRPRVGYGRRYL